MCRYGYNYVPRGSGTDVRTLNFRRFGHMNQTISFAFPTFGFYYLIRIITDVCLYPSRHTIPSIRTSVWGSPFSG